MIGGYGVFIIRGNMQKWPFSLVLDVSNNAGSFGSKCSSNQNESFVKFFKVKENKKRCKDRKRAKDWKGEERKKKESGNTSR